MEELIACVKCEEAIPIGKRAMALHTKPQFVLDKTTGEVVEIPKDDLESFYKDHEGEGHSFEKLVVIDGPWSEQPFSEPVSVSLYNVQGQNGEKFVVKCVKRSRDNIEESFRYEVIRGRVKYRLDSIEVQEEAIVEELLRQKPEFGREEFAWRIEDLVEAVKDYLQSEETFIREEVTSGFHTMEDNGNVVMSEYPSVFYAKLSDSFIRAILTHIRACFCNGNGERLFLEKFVEGQNEPYGVMALKLKFGFSLLACAPR